MRTSTYTTSSQSVAPATSAPAAISRNVAYISDTVAAANKVTNTLTFTGYQSKSFNGSAAVSVAIPNNTNQLTNGAGFITSSASISGNAGSATSYKQPELLMVLHLMVLLTLLRQIGVLLEVFISKMLQLLIPVRRLV